MSNASIRIEQLMLPTYPEPGKEEIPLFSEHRVHQRSTGRPYPNKVVLEVNRERKIERSYTVVHLENEYLDVLVLPEIGGRIFAARDKVTDYDFFYRQHVIKPGLIGALGSWISGGVEFNWPYHHRPSGFLPCDFETEECGDGSVICWLSEHDPIDRMKGMVGIVLRPGCEPSDAVKQEILDYCRQHIAKYAMPYDIEFRPELPKTLVGKVAYRVLEEEEAERQALEDAKNS